MDQAAAQMNAAVDGAMARAAESVDQARSGLEAQGQTMLAMIEQSRAAFEQAGAETTRGLAERLDMAGQKIEMLAGRLATQDKASRTLLGNLARQLAELDAQFAEVGEKGDEQNARLTRSLGRAARDRAGAAARDRSGARPVGRDDRPDARAGGGARRRSPPNCATRCRRHGRGRDPGRAHRRVGAKSVSQDGSDAGRRGAGRRQHRRERGEHRPPARVARSPARHARARARARRRRRLRALGAAVGETDGAAAQLVKDTGPELIEALVRVREAAAQAASHAREAIAAVIPESVAALVEASRGAVGEAIDEPVQEQIDEIGNASHLALAAAQGGERAADPAVADASAKPPAAIEERIADDRAEREEKEAEALSRRVALIIDALNSTAIDVTKILSNEVGDAAWAAYLKGDRGVFTRRAVRLLESGEAREILRHYEEEPDFRDQVNRYIHDFEAMLRRVLADRDGTALGVTLLSSDMGKLYVALAQAIERIRR